MKVPLQIVFRNMDASDAISMKIREGIAWLEHFNDHIISCRVAVEIPHRRHQTGNIYRVRIDLRVPGGEIVVSRNPDRHEAGKDLYVTLHESFDEIRRKLEDYTRKRRLEVKRLESPPRGRVVRLVEDDGKYGFLRTEDGRELYFHSNSVIGHQYGLLEEGTEVRYAEEMGDEGPQASTVEIVGRHFQKVARKAS